MTRTTIHKLGMNIAHTLSLIAAAEVSGNTEMVNDLTAVYHHLEEQLMSSLDAAGYTGVVFIQPPLDVSDLITPDDLPF
jgi:hypothetical protein